jgi:hypothetical protein
MQILKDSWKSILIKGKQNSGKSDLALWFIKQIIDESKHRRINQLLDDQEKVLFLTESVDQVELIKRNLNNKIHIVENISIKDPLDYIMTYHRQYSLEVVVIDYINLLNDVNNMHTISLILDYLSQNNIRWIFVESTKKLLLENLRVEKDADYVFNTSKPIGHANEVEIILVKDQGISLFTPKQYWLNLK